MNEIYETEAYARILASMQERYRNLTGFDADAASDIGIRLKVLAAEAAEISSGMDALGRELFPQTASGDYLDLHAEQKGLARKPALRAAGVLRFSRETPASQDIAVPAGIVASTRPDPQTQEQLEFVTTGSAVLPAGKYYVEVPAEAVLAGAAPNAAAGAVCRMVSPASGISQVSNPAAFAGGVDREGDEALRQRLLLAYRNISNGTNSAFYYDLAMSREGVASVNVLPRKRGRGTVDVVVACYSADEAEAIVAALQHELDVKKEINVDVLVLAAAEQAVNVSVEVAASDGYNPALVDAEVRGRLAGLLAAIPVGAPLLLANIGRAILETDGVYNYRILGPAADVYPASDRVLRAGNIAVGRMAVG